MLVNSLTKTYIMNVKGILDVGVLTNRRTASYTLAIDDSTKIVEMNVASSNNLTVPPNSTVAFPIGTQVMVSWYGVGQPTIVAGSGVTLRSTGGALKIAERYSVVTLIKIATNEWYVVGNLTT